MMSLVGTRPLFVDTAKFDAVEPGNGTRYDMIAVRIDGTVQCGRLGRITSGWLIVCGITQKAYLFGDGDVIAGWYVEEKLGVGKGDSAEVAKQVARLIGGTVA